MEFKHYIPHKQTNEKTKVVSKAIDDLIKQAEALAVDEVERLVKLVLPCGKFDHFNMCNGRATFWFLDNKHTLDVEDIDAVTINYTLDPYGDSKDLLPLLFDEAEKIVIRDLYEFIGDHDDDLKITGRYLCVKWINNQAIAIRDSTQYRAVFGWG